MVERWVKNESKYLPLGIRIEREGRLPRLHVPIQTTCGPITTRAPKTHRMAGKQVPLRGETVNHQFVIFFLRFFFFFFLVLIITNLPSSIFLVLLFLPEKRSKYGTDRNPRHTRRDRAPCLRQTSSGNNLVLFATLSLYSL
jgi:hypothetical protein